MTPQTKECWSAFQLSMNSVEWKYELDEQTNTVYHVQGFFRAQHTGMTTLWREFRDQYYVTKNQAREDAIEAAYWEMDDLRKKPRNGAGPMSERDAFKAVVRGLLREHGSK